jgi:galactokinase
MSESLVRDLFVRRFGAEPTVIGVAPGRINLIGEHTDYNDGFVFPAAIDKETYIAASGAEGPTELYSEQVGEGQPFDAATVAVGEISTWSKYAAGMAWAMREHGAIPNLKVVITSTVPRSGGVSSSAALEMAFGVVWNRLAGLGLAKVRLAQLGQKCENGYVGVNCGIMDQVASAMGKAEMAMFLDTRSLQIEYAPIPPGLSAVLCDTRKPRALTNSAYNERRSQCEAASAVLGVPSLRDADMALLTAKKNELDEVTFRRARHVITEDDRCVSFKAALEARDLTKVGELMKASHESLRDDYEVSCFELDVMAEAAQRAPGCIGARMTGAGFGGSCVALVRNDALDAFVKETLAAYKSRSSKDGAALSCSIVEGARVLDERKNV